ncbi:MAG: serine/threonine-protein kinase [Cyanobacteriota bacterium]|nr:serine/threonine-protein kinase [Cyanobacteriota bacterium]
MVWQPGKTLRGDRYTIEAILGRGRFGITYLAWEKNGTRVAIKTPNDEVRSLNPAKFDRLQRGFVQKAVKLAKCRHPHLVRAEEPFREDGIWCIAMEYIYGLSLARRATAKLPEVDAVKYVRQIGEALGVMHENGLLHRDVQPKNIMVRLRLGKPEAVLIDFGLARNVGEAITQTRTSGISDGFSPLELYSSGRKCGRYTDIYALGATLYNLVTGKIPPNAPDRKIHRRALRFPNGISDNVRKGIQLAIELEPQNRPQSMKAWLKLLEAPPPKPKLSQPTRHIPWGALTVMFVLCVLLGFLLALFFNSIVGALAESGSRFWEGAESRAFARALAEVFAGILAGALAGVFAGAGALTGIRAWYLAGAGTVALTGIGAWYLAWYLAGGWVVLVAVGGVMAVVGTGALAVASKTLLKSFNRFHTFLILVATSGLGLALGGGWLMWWLLSHYISPS